jgi:hypothetical protein
MNYVADLHSHRVKHFSQNAEDGVIERLFEIFGTTNRYYVEIGTGDGSECNTRWLREQHGLSVVMIDCAYANPSIGLHQEFVTAENVNDVLAKHGVPEAPDLLSIDIDGQDYWLWQAVAARRQPRVVVIEFNAGIPHDVAVTIPYDTSYRWCGQPNAGQSLLALQKLSTQNGYSLLYAAAPNAFLARTAILPRNYREVSTATAARLTYVEKVYHRRRWKKELCKLTWVPV